MVALHGKYHPTNQNLPASCIHNICAAAADSFSTLIINALVIQIFCALGGGGEEEERKKMLHAHLGRVFIGCQQGECGGKEGCVKCKHCNAALLCGEPICAQAHEPVCISQQIDARLTNSVEGDDADYWMYEIGEVIQVEMDYGNFPASIGAQWLEIEANPFSEDARAARQAKRDAKKADKAKLKAARDEEKKAVTQKTAAAIKLLDEIIKMYGKLESGGNRLTGGSAKRKKKVQRARKMLESIKRSKFDKNVIVPAKDGG